MDNTDSTGSIQRERPFSPTRLDKSIYTLPPAYTHQVYRCRQSTAAAAYAKFPTLSYFSRLKSLPNRLSVAKLALSAGDSVQAFDGAGDSTDRRLPNRFRWSRTRCTRARSCRCSPRTDPCRRATRRGSCSRAAARSCPWGAGRGGSRPPLPWTPGPRS